MRLRHANGYIMAYTWKTIHNCITEFYLTNTSCKMWALHKFWYVVRMKQKGVIRTRGTTQSLNTLSIMLVSTRSCKLCSRASCIGNWCSKTLRRLLRSLISISWGWVLLASWDTSFTFAYVKYLSLNRSIVVKTTKLIIKPTKIMPFWSRPASSGSAP